MLKPFIRILCNNNNKKKKKKNFIFEMCVQSKVYLPYKFHISQKRLETS